MAAPHPSRSTAWAAVALALLAFWLVLLMSGITLRGGVHLLLAAAFAAFPWRAARGPGLPSA